MQEPEDPDPRELASGVPCSSLLLQLRTLRAHPRPQPNPIAHRGESSSERPQGLPTWVVTQGLMEGS